MVKKTFIRQTAGIICLYSFRRRTKKLQILLLVIQAPEIVLLDEPFSGLDKKSVLNLISLLQESRSTKIFISHQLFGLDKIISSAYLIKNKKLIKMENIS